MGIMVSVFSGFLFAVLMYAFITFIGVNIPQMQIDDLAKNMDKLRESGFISEEKIDSIMQKFEESKDAFTAGNIAISGFEEHFFGGLIISLIIAGVYFKKQPPIDTTNLPDSNLD